MHRHHIVPKHMGGSDEPSNLVRLTVEEHAEAHRKLFEQHNRIEDYLAWKGLLGLVTKEEIVRTIQSHTAKKTFTGRPKTEAQKAKIKESNVGKHNHNGESNPMFGHKHTDEAKATMSFKMMGRSACRWITNGLENNYIMKDLPTPDGWRNGRTMKTGADGRVLKGSK